MRVENTVFISYAYRNVYNALAICQRLHAHGFDVFFDYESYASGSLAHLTQFGEAATRALEALVLNQITARAHFVWLLPGASDWQQQQFDHAISQRRHIIALILDIPLQSISASSYFEAYSKSISAKLKEQTPTRVLRVTFDPFNFGEVMDELRECLGEPLDITLHAPPPDELPVLEQIQARIAAQPPVTETQLIAEKYLLPGYHEPDFLVRASWSHFHDEDEWIGNCNEARRLNPDSVLAHYLAGRAMDDDGRTYGAIDAYSEVLRLRPAEWGVYYRRGAARERTDDLDGALADYDQTLRLNPHHRIAYLSRGQVYEKQGDLRRANLDFQTYVESGGHEAAKVRKRIQENEEKLRLKKR